MQMLSVSIFKEAKMAKLNAADDISIERDWVKSLALAALTFGLVIAF